MATSATQQKHSVRSVGNVFLIARRMSADLYVLPPSLIFFLTIRQTPAKPSQRRRGKSIQEVSVLCWTGKIHSDIFPRSPEFFGSQKVRNFRQQLLLTHRGFETEELVGDLGLIHPLLSDDDSLSSANFMLVAQPNCEKWKLHHCRRECRAVKTGWIINKKSSHSSACRF